MTPHHKRLLDLYTDYLLVSFGPTTATGMARLLPDISHDQVTRFLSQHELSDQDLWPIVKPHLRRIEAEDAVVIIDDSIEAKPYTDESELITWHFDHCLNATVKGINLLSALYFSQGVSLPVGFELIKKTLLVTHPKTGKDKWQSPVTKNELARQMIAAILAKRIRFRYVLMDTWFAAVDNMLFIKQKAKKDFIVPLKGNRRVAVSPAAQKRGRWTNLDALNLESDAPVTLYLEGVPFPILVVRAVFTNEDGSESILYLASSDLSLSADQCKTIYQKRWKVEEYHKSLKSNAALAKSLKSNAALAKSLKSNAALAKSPTKLPHTQSNHFFASLVAFVKLEVYRTQTHLNHFALKGKLYQAAIASAYQQLQHFKLVCPLASITP